jgi:formylglycine-generating enzyme required for sulfatase activity
MNKNNDYCIVNRVLNPINISKGLSNLSDRELMGLPDYYVSGNIEKEITSYYSELFNLSKSELLNLIEDQSMPFIKRYTSGQILALKGDPRISTLNPNMIEVPSWSGYLGLDSNEVQKITNEYESIGVLKEWIEKETPKYFIEIKAFKIAKYLITNKEYLEFLEDSKYEEIPDSWKFGQYPHQLANHPAYTLSDTACINYCEWISKKTGRKFRLPTEAEWEYAAGGTTGFEFPWGQTFLSDCANTLESGILQSTPIGIFPKGNSPFGCCDMAGNVEEYVLDYYSGYNNQEMIVDDLVEANGIYRVARGGSFTRFRDLSRNKRRHGRYPKEIYVMGFRLAEHYF